MSATIHFKVTVGLGHGEQIRAALPPSVSIYEIIPQEPFQDFEVWLLKGDDFPSEWDGMYAIPVFERDPEGRVVVKDWGVA